MNRTGGVCLAGRELRALSEGRADLLREVGGRALEVLALAMELRLEDLGFLPERKMLRLGQLGFLGVLSYGRLVRLDRLVTRRRIF